MCGSYVLCLNKHTAEWMCVVFIVLQMIDYAIVYNGWITSDTPDRAVAVAVGR